MGNNDALIKFIYHESVTHRSTATINTTKQTVVISVPSLYNNPVQKTTTIQPPPPSLFRYDDFSKDKLKYQNVNKLKFVVVTNNETLVELVVKNICLVDMHVLKFQVVIYIR